MSCGCGGGESKSDFDFQYSAKLLCGEFAEKGPLGKGSYRTVINIHNPSRCDGATFAWKVAQSHAVDSDPGKISEYFEASLNPDGTAYLDCEHALKKAGFGGVTGFDGWLVIEGPDELDVEAVHTVQPSKAEGASSISVTRVCARLIPKCVSDQIDLSTGVADWQVVSTSGTSRAAIVDPSDPDSHNQWAISQGWQPLGGTRWAYDPLNHVAGGTTEFQLSFDLKFCGPYKQKAQTVTILCDNLAVVALNGVLLQGGNGAPTPYQVMGPSGSPCTLTIPAGAFKSGHNVFSVKIKSLDEFGGFALHSIPSFEGAFCSAPSIPSLPCPTIEFDTYCNKGTIPQEHWSSVDRNGAWFPSSSTLQCCPNAIAILDAIKKFKVQITNASSIPGVHVKYFCYVEDKTGSSSQTFGPVYDGVECGETANDRAINYIRVAFVNAPVGCSIHYMVERSKKHSVHREGMDWSYAGDVGWSIHCMAIWT